MILTIFCLQGVEAERCASFANAIKHGKPIYTTTEVSLADGLAVPTVGCNALATASKYSQDLVTEWPHILIFIWESVTCICDIASHEKC